MTQWNDPLYRSIIAHLPAGTKASDYITSLSVSARRGEGRVAAAAGGRAGRPCAYFAGNRLDPAALPAYIDRLLWPRSPRRGYAEVGYIASQRPLIVQSDSTLLLEVDHPDFEEIRDRLNSFAELIKSPEYVHTYRITPLSLWNAASSGVAAETILDTLTRYSRYQVPDNIRFEIVETVNRYGRVVLDKRDGELLLSADDPLITQEIEQHKPLREAILGRRDERTLLVKPLERGNIKLALLRLGYPVKDRAGYVDGERLEIGLRDRTLLGQPFGLRGYQLEALSAFYREGSAESGSGVLVLPCGAGKTIIGIAAMARLSCHTLVLATNIVALRQWRDEILDKTTLTDEHLAEYSGEKKSLAPITLATYQILTYRRHKEDDFPHFSLFNARNWGLIIYDEVHLLPAPVFRVTAEVQARRRLGLTATLVREDGKEAEVFSLIGPKRYDVPWKQLEKQGWIAPVTCYEIRLPMDSSLRVDYASASFRNKYRVAAENPRKLEVVDRLVARHEGDQTLIIGMYLSQLSQIARRLRAPLITGSTPNLEREELYHRFRIGEVKTLVVSKVANFAIDLPDANVAIQVSGTFGSRQEEAQRLGRILRPKPGGESATFYSLVTRESRDQEFSAKRQLFLTEQGYRYVIGDEGLLESILARKAAVD
ncbi:DEAD/DEAH box helicase [bacterium]|nr:DEAD/DEAH box helicase [bacterium]